MDKQHHFSKGIITMEKSLPEGANINMELIKDYLTISGAFERNLKYMQIVDIILNNLEPDTNMYFGTYENVSKELGISYSTVARTFTTLIDHGILERVNKGVYRINATLLKASVYMLRVKYIRNEEPK
jgi:predicted transcriptional regulator of viral defense system